MTFRQQQYSRLAALVALICSLIWFLWPSPEWVIEGEPLAVLISASFLFLAAEISFLAQIDSEKERAKKKQDAKNFQELKIIIDSNALHFLETRELKDYPRQSEIDFMENFYDRYARGNTTKFNLKKFDTKFQDFLKCFIKFYISFSQKMFLENEMYSWRPTVHDKELFDLKSKEMDELNKQAGELAKKWRALVSYGEDKYVAYLDIKP